MDENQKQIIDDIGEDETLKNYFFTKLASTSNPFPWLSILRDKGYFEPEKNPLPKEIPGKKGFTNTTSWNVLGYLENISKQNSKDPNKEISHALIEIINRIINYDYRPRNYYTDYMMLKIIFNLPIDKINNNHINFIRIALNSNQYTSLVSSEISTLILPQFINAKSEEKLMLLLDVILDYKKVHVGKTYDYYSVMEDFWLNDTLKKHKKAIIDVCGIESAKIALKKIESILKEDQTQFNIVWIPAIENHSQTQFPDRYECQLVYFVRDTLERISEINLIREMVINLLNHDYPILRRIAVHTIDKYYEKLNDMFWNWNNENPLKDIDLKHELYWLFKNNSNKFEKIQISKILGWINDTKLYKSYADEDEDANRQGIAYNKKGWLSSILDTNDRDILKAYETYNNINDSELSHPDFNIWSEFRRGDISPNKKTDFMNKSNDDITDILNNFNEEDTSPFNPSKRGLSETFRNYVIENPNQFTSELEPFLEVENIYKHALLWGLDDAWKAEKEEFHWDELFDFILEMIHADSFWNVSEERDKQDLRLIISQIAFLIEDGTKEDRHAFDFGLMPRAESVLKILAEHTESYVPKMIDTVTSVLNSPRGNIYSAMVNYSLRYLRVKNEWIDSIKYYFDEGLIKPSMEFSVTLGKYLPYFYALSKDWVPDNIDLIFPENDEFWEPAFDAYLFYSSTIYENIYDLLKNHGDYQRAIKSNLGTRHHYVNQRIIQHICTIYLDGDEELEDCSLICILIKNKDCEQLSTLIRWFIQIKKEDRNLLNEKILSIWKAIIDILSPNQEDPEYQRIIANLSSWLELINDIDSQTLKWLELSAKYVNLDNFTTREFLKNLALNVERSPGDVLKLFNIIIESGLPCFYEEEGIYKIVKTLYEKGYKKESINIINAYESKGHHFLRDIVE